MSDTENTSDIRNDPKKRNIELSIDTLLEELSDLEPADISLDEQSDEQSKEQLDEQPSKTVFKPLKKNKVIKVSDAPKSPKKALKKKNKTLQSLDDLDDFPKPLKLVRQNAKYYTSEDEINCEEPEEPKNNIKKQISRKQLKPKEVQDKEEQLIKQKEIRKKTIIYDIDEAINIFKCGLSEATKIPSKKQRDGTLTNTDIDILIKYYNKHFTIMDNIVVDYLNEICDDDIDVDYKKIAKKYRNAKDRFKRKVSLIIN